MRTSAYISLFASVTAAFIGSGCASNASTGGARPSGADASSVIDQCSLLTNAEVGVFAETTIASSAPSAVGCGYVPKGETLAVMGVDILKLEASSATEQLKLTHSGDLVAVKGVGDSAAYNVPPGNSGELGALMVVARGVAVRFDVIFVGVKPGSDKYNALLALASKAIGRLPWGAE